VTRAADRLRLIVDTDGGVDDLTALWWLLGRDEVDLVAIVATWGNVDAVGAADNVARVLHAAGRPDITLALGALGPTGPAPLEGVAAHVHGDDGFGGSAAAWPTGGIGPVRLPVNELLSGLTEAEPGALDLLTLGPLSTLAGALDADPAIAGRVRSLTMMGGSVRRGGNALPWVEANVGHDPGAAAAVVAARWASPPLLVGLDATLAARLTADDLAAADAGTTTAARMLAAPLQTYAAFYASTGLLPEGTFPCHDLLAAMAAVDPTIITEQRTVPLAVDTGGSAAWGMTVADLRQAPQSTAAGFRAWRVALDADGERFRAGFTDLLT
jgi:inosine-uridine nucleoside N-ribohydrolase